MSQPNAVAEGDRSALADTVARLLLWARRVAPAPMSSTSITTLDRLAYAGALRVTELAEREGVSQPSMTTLVNRLEAEGFAERLPDPTDGRAALVGITPAGRAVLVERHSERSAALSVAIARLPHDQQASLAAARGALDALTRTILNHEGSHA